VKIARALPLPLLLASFALPACGTSFAPESLVESVRLLAISADTPYAAPGATVTMSALAYDGRPNVTPLMPEKLVYWVPIVCPDPPGDSYFACYPAFGEVLEPGVDLTSVLAQGTSFSFKMPVDVITAHPRSGSGSPYGMVVVFAMACAGHVQFVGVDEDTLPPAPPLGCFDDGGAELGPDDSVFAYAQVYSFADGRTNANPVIDGLTFGGGPVDPTQGITVGPCPGPRACPSNALDTVVPSSSQELDPADLSPSGVPLHEEIWVDYYLTAGTVGGPALLYDATAGKVATSAVQLTAPTVAVTGPQFLWAVVHDNRGGVKWLQVPLNVQP
jgi:hypothetical protein